MKIEETIDAIEALSDKEAIGVEVECGCCHSYICLTDDLKALAKAFRTLHDTVKRYANEDAWTGQFSKDGRQDLWLYGEGKATAVQALKSLGDIVN